MCFVIGRVETTGNRRLILANNRDERYDRPSNPPTLHEGGNLAWYGPQDRQAGGTWFGLNEAGLVVSITNPLDPSNDSNDRPSRGLLVRKILESADSLDTAEEMIEGISEDDYKSYVLMVLGPGGLIQATNSSRNRQSLSGELCFYQTQKEFSKLPLEQRHRLPWGPGNSVPLDRIQARLQHFCKRHDSFKNRESICSHDDESGTVSSAITILQDPGRAHEQGQASLMMNYSDGPPCETIYQARELPEIVARGFQSTWFD